ncbi:SUMF1/EgtB/PvdO family nonheme iron enzyme [Chitinispirillales bacterium ANBcel5]|uniref:SUMF1/EgtB/PvdO family nonheme iron enzyme n=1 Tax=Cellulosispirillum alkaliphilum TaxID=3039283 RepID=UPI002A4E8C2C|nr:SUMF1/EgtB/PvdO family nonheme iron enzyme [Chitinispirillales bacterium ANBcel5]
MRSNLISILLLVMFFYSCNAFKSPTHPSEKIENVNVELFINEKNKAGFIEGEEFSFQLFIYLPQHVNEIEISFGIDEWDTVFQYRNVDSFYDTLEFTSNFKRYGDKKITATLYLGENSLSKTDTLPITIMPAIPKITSNPEDQNITIGSLAVFSVSAEGSSIRYQWQRNELDIAGEQSASLVLTNLSLLNSNEKYRCIVTNASGSDTSETATLFVVEEAIAPNIINEPQDAYVKEGETVSFYVEASGTNLQYQWLKNGDRIEKANTNRLNLEQVSINKNGSSFKCVVSNSEGTDTSQSATLTVTEQVIAPQIVKHPKDIKVIDGDSAVFSVEATGTDLDFQWLKDSVVIEGANEPRYTLSSIGQHDGAVFACIVSNSKDSIVSNDAILNVLFTITYNGNGEDGGSIPVDNNSYPSGYEATVRNNLSTGGLYKKGYTFGGWIENTNEGNVLNGGNTIIIKNSLTLYAVWIPELKLTKQPDDMQISSGESVSFSVEVVGGSNLRFEWYRDDNYIPNSNNPVLKIPVATLLDSGNYYCVIKSSSKSIVSNKAKLSVQPAPWRPSEPKEYKNGMVKVIAKGYGFNMGATEIAEPITEVTFTYDFWIDTVPVTISKYHSVMGSSPDYDASHDHPIHEVTWYNAARYCNALSIIHGLEPVYDTTVAGFPINYNKNGYRLPTEAEWEYACRAGSETRYFWGYSFDDSYVAYFNEEFQPVGTVLPNNYGIYEMLGSVFEWCNDYEELHPGGSLVDPKGGNYPHPIDTRFPDYTVRVLRGGKYLNNDLFDYRSAQRSVSRAVLGLDRFGFRVVLPIQE